MRIMMEKKEKKNKIGIFVFDFLDCEEKYWNFEAIFYIRITKGFIYKIFPSLCCVYFGPASLP